ncbi:MAG: penicillin acylase family protein, partial [Actinomycetota bacterium]|nr:penicillin acylase family protein [Actinomycetota bacterium]
MRRQVGVCVLTAVALVACTDDGPGTGGEASTASPPSAVSTGVSTVPTTGATTPRGTDATTPPGTDSAGTTASTDATDPTDASTASTSGDTTATTPATEPADATYEAAIRRTTDGVAHISGDTIGDVSFGQGYANAEDHACSLADQVLKVQGRRAAAFGPGEGNENVESDFAWLAIGIDELARQDFAEAADDVTSLFDAFAAGWNGYLEEVGVDGLSGWCAGEDWVEPVTGADIYSYSRSISLLASGGALTGFIASAQPPASEDAAGLTASAAVDGWLNAGDLGSNGWAVGSESVTGGEGGLLVANPHFPWEGERRFWEVHLTVPGEMDIYGVQLLGLPGVGIGFTENFAWTHTVSAGNRFTAYTLDLDPQDPTSYLLDGQSKPMTSQRHRVEIMQPDGST